MGVRGGTPIDVSADGLMNAGLVLAGVAAFVVVVDWLGFVLTSGLILFGLLWKYGTRWWVSAAITVLLVPAVYQLFAHLLRVPLPRGLLGW